jgi:hypothetical protein
MDRIHTKEVLHEVSARCLLRLVAEHEHVSGTFARTEVCGQVRQSESGVVLHRVDHASKSCVGSHLNSDLLVGPVGAGLIVYGGVERDGIVIEELVGTTG